MKNELRYGHALYISFIILDIACLILANHLASILYLKGNFENYGYQEHRSVEVFMILIDLLVTFTLNSLCRVLRRKDRIELWEGIKHIGVSIAALTVVLFSLRQGAVYSRVTVFLAYGIYYLLFVLSHIVWKRVLIKLCRDDSQETALLMTTDRFVDEGLSELAKLGLNVKSIYLLKNLGRNEIKGIAVVKTWEEAAAVICWERIDKVYIYGLDHQMVSKYMLNACKEMGLKLDLVDFNYRVMEIKTVRAAEAGFGSLSFLEGKRDIPFPIRRVYWITETDAEMHRGFHAHKLNCQLLFCPYGTIDILVDDGQKKSTIRLDRPGKGLLLMPGLWREMVWKESGSVLCVLASEYYDEKEYIRDYDEFLEYNKRYRDGMDPLKQGNTSKLRKATNE